MPPEGYVPRYPQELYEWLLKIEIEQEESDKEVVKEFLDSL